ncbi:hypothetical protein GEMRC1_003546 [Eukaryota sp. GEM-RC1]
MKQIKHPNVIQLKEVLSSRSRLFIVVELADGELFDLIAKTKCLPEPQAANYFHQLIRGLRFLHAHNIAHRDLKPENILLSEGKILKITDFGLSRIVEDSLTKTTCGTIHYVAPDVLTSRNHGGYDPFKSDIWSAGIVLYVMTAGYLPFDHRLGNKELFRQICAGRYPEPMFFSPLLKDLLRQILVVDPAKRADLDTILEHEWFRTHKDSISFLDSDIDVFDVNNIRHDISAITATGNIVIENGSMSPGIESEVSSPSSQSGLGDSISFSTDDLLHLASTSQPEVHYMEQKKVVAVSTTKSLGEVVEVVMPILKSQKINAQPRSGNRIKIIVDQTIILCQVVPLSSGTNVFDD